MTSSEPLLNPSHPGSPGSDCAIAAWIAALELDDTIALRSVRSSLRPRPPERAYAGADEDEMLDDDAQAYYDEVCDARAASPSPLAGAADGAVAASPGHFPNGPNRRRSIASPEA